MPLRDEKGAALVVALVFLLVLSLLVGVLHRDALVEIVSSRTYQESERVFYMAESGLRDANAWLAGQGVAPENGLNPPAWFYLVPVDPPTLDSGWSAYVSSGNVRYRYYVEHIKDALAAVAGGESAKIGTTTATGGRVHYYRITAEGSNADGSIRKQVQIVTTARY